MGVITGLQAMISVVVDMLPVPGGMGASENLFMQIFLPIFGPALVLPGMLISRGVGTSILPIRIARKPQIHLITIDSAR